MTDHAHELRRYARKIAHPAGEVPAVMRAAADEIERLQAKIEATEKSDSESIAMYRKARDERDELRAKIEAMERQEPVVSVWRCDNGHIHGSCEKTLPMGAKLYALPGAKGEGK